MEAVETYRKWVREFADAGPSTLDGHSNHLPITLAALALDDASPATLDQFARHYASKLEPRRPARTVPLFSWQSAWDCRAQSNRYWDVEAYFRAVLDTDGLKRTLAAWVPRLLPGMAAGAYHGLLRTAYAIRLEEPAEIASGLATWVTSFFAMPLPRGASMPAATQLKRMDEAPALQPGTWTRPLIMGRLREVAGHAVFTDLLHPLPAVDFDSALHQLGHRAAERHGETQDSASLHLVTAVHALTMLEPHLPDRSLALQLFWPSYAGTWVVGSSAGHDEAAETGDPDLQWAAIRERVQASADEHAVKLVFSCAELHARWRDDSFRTAASRMVSLLKH